MALDNAYPKVYIIGPYYCSIVKFFVQFKVHVLFSSALTDSTKTLSLSTEKLEKDILTKFHRSPTTKKSYQSGIELYLSKNFYLLNTFRTSN